MHSLLESQLRKHFGSLDNIPEEWKKFLEELSLSLTEQEQAARAPSLDRGAGAQASPRQFPQQATVHHYFGKSTERLKEPTIEVQQAWGKGKTVIRRSNVEESARETRIAVPIKIREQTLGALNLSFEDNNSAQQTLPLLEQLSNRLALAMENAQLFAETQTSLARTEALYQLSRAAIAFEDIPDLLQTLVNRIAETLPADRVSLITFETEKKLITNFYKGGPGSDQIDSAVDFDELQNGLSGWATREQKAIISSKNSHDSHESADAQQPGHETNCGSILVVPLISRSRVIGTITATNTLEQRDFNQQDADLMMAMAGQAATAYENARLFQAQQQRAAELLAAAEVSRAASSILELHELLSQTVEVIRERFGLYYVGIFLVDVSGDWAELRAGTGEAGRIQIERNHKLRVGGESMIGQCISISAPRIAQDVVDETLRFKNPVLPDTRSEMALPLMSRGQTIGAMTIQSTQPLAFNEENITTLQTMADQLANAILNAQLFAQTQARAKELSTLNEMARVLTETLDIDSIVEQVYQFASRLVDTTNFYLALYYPEQNEIEFKLYTIDGKRVTIRDQRRKAGKGMTEHVIRTRRPLFIEENVEEYIKNITGVEAIGQSAQCWLGVPMTAGNQVIGMINVQNYETPFYFSSQDQQLLFAIASQAAIAIQNARLFEQTQRQNKELAVLNEMGGVLNTILERDVIIEKVYEFTSQLMEFTTFAIGLYHPEQDEISLPLVIEGGKRHTPQRFSRKGGLMDYVIRTKNPLLLPDNVQARAKEFGIEIQVIRTTGEGIESWVGAPVQVGNIVIGVLTVQSTTTTILYTERHRDLLSSIANLAANALENSRLFEQTQLQNQELAILNEMGRVLNSLLDKDILFENILLHSSQLIDFTSFLVALYEPEKDEISFPFIVEKGERLSLPPAQGTDSLLGYVIRSKTPLLIPENLEAYTSNLGISLRTVGEVAKSWLAVPILLGDVVAGVISIQTVTTPRLYTVRHRDLMISIANQAAIALQNATLFEQAQRQNLELAILNEMSRVLTTLLDVDAIIAQIYTYATRLIRTVDFFVALFDESTQIISFPYVIDEGERIEVPSRELKNSLTDYVIRQKEALLLKSVDSDQIAQMGISQFIIGNPPLSWLGVPIIVGQSVIGVIGVQSVTQRNAYTERDRDLLATLASQAAIAIQNARSFQQTVHRSDDLTTLNEMGRVLSNLLDISKILEKVYEFSSRLFDTTTFFIALYNEETTEVNFLYSISNGVYTPPVSRPLGNGLTDYIIRTRKPLLIQGNVIQRTQELGLDQVYFGDDRPAQSWLGVPIVLGDSIIGAISVQSLITPHLYNEYHRDLLTSIASQTAITLQNAQLFQQTQAALAESTEQARRLAVLNEMSAQLAQTANLDEVFTQAAAYISQIYKADRVSFSMLVPDNQVELRAVYGEQAELYLGQRLSLAGTANESAIVENRIVIVGDTHQTSEGSVRSFMVAPILVEGQVIGTLNVGSYQLNHYTSRDENFVQQVVSLLSTLIANRQLFEQVQNALSETESLYQASAELNAVQSYTDVLQTLRSYTVLGKDQQAIVNLAYYDVPWTAKTIPEWLIILERWTPVPLNLPYRYPLQQFQWLTQNFKPNRTLYLPNSEDPDLDAVSRKFAEQAGFKSAIFVPLIVGGQWRGHVSGFYFTPTAFSEDDIRLLTALANQAAVAIQGLQNIELAQQRAREAQQRSEELALVNRVVASVAESFDLLESLTIVADELGQATGAGRVGVALINEEETELKVVTEYRMDTSNPSAIGLVIPVKGNASTEKVIETKKSLFIENAQSDPTLAPLHDAFKERGILSLVILPLLARGKVVGTIGLDILEQGGKFTQDQLRLAESIVLQASNAIYNAQLYEQTQQALSETATLYQASGELNGVQTYDDILGVLQKYTILGHERLRNVSIYLFDRVWTKEEKPETLIPLARWSRVPVPSASKGRSSLADWPNASELFVSDAITFVENVATDLRTKKDAARTVYQEIMHAKSIIYVPLVISREWIGQIIGTYDQPVLLTQHDNRRLTSLAQQATIALQNLRLLAESQQRAAQLLTAAEIARSASETLSQNELLFRTVNLIRDRFNFYHASVFLLDDSRQWAIIQESTGEAGAEMKRRQHRLEVGSQSIIGTVTFTGTSLIVNDVSKDGVHRPNPLLPDTKAELGIPLKLGRRVIGALDVQATEVDAFTADDVAVLQILADQVAIAVDNSRSYTIAQDAVKDANDRLEEISALFEISQSLTSAPLLTEQIAEIIATRIGRVLEDVSNCGIYLFDEDTDTMRQLLYISAQNGSHPESEDPPTRIYPLADFPSRLKVIETLQPLAIQSDDPEVHPNETQYLKQSGIQNLLILPLAAKGQAFGLIEIESREKKRNYTPDQINLALTVANQGAAAMDNAHLYEEQIKTAEQLREVDKLKNQFLANMSHELRTPLNSIIGFSRVILKGIDGPITDLQEQDLNAIYNAGTHLLGLINDILDISRIEAGKMELSFEEVDIATLITSVMSTAKGLLKEKAVQLESYIEPYLPKVKADPTRMRQIVLNLLQNASKFTDEGSITVKAERQFNSQGKPEVMVSVTDSGVGISPEDQKKLFQPFSQVDASPTRKAGGTGLGLSITRNLIELHGGTIDVISDVNKGSTFFFTIPAIAPTGALANTETTLLPDAESSYKIVLAIEDDPQIIHLYQRYLEPEGYQVVPLTDSTKAVQQARDILPFAITLDVHMPNLDGWQVIKALKSTPETRNIPVIFCTIVENQAKGYSLGAADYLMKPILGEDLINALVRLETETEIKHILVIDDDPDDLRLVEKALQMSGTYQVRLAQGGKKGLEAMQKNKPDAVILDLSMPEIDGFKVLERMRSDKQFKNIPVIILTALDLSVEQQKLLAEYTQDQLRKGFLEADGLLACLQQTLRTNQNRDKN